MYKQGESLLKGVKFTTVSIIIKFNTEVAYLLLIARDLRGAFIMDSSFLECILERELSLEEGCWVWSLITVLILYKQQFLHSDWLRASQLILNQCKKLKLSAERWNWVQKSEIECKTVKLKWLTASSLSLDKKIVEKNNGGQNLNKDWNSLSKFQYNYLITKQSVKLNNNN